MSKEKDENYCSSTSSPAWLCLAVSAILHYIPAQPSQASSTTQQKEELLQTPLHWAAAAVTRLPYTAQLSGATADFQLFHLLLFTFPLTYTLRAIQVKTLAGDSLPLSLNKLQNLCMSCVEGDLEKFRKIRDLEFFQVPDFSMQDIHRFWSLFDDKGRESLASVFKCIFN